MTPLMWAVNFEFIDIVKLLLKHTNKLNINASDEESHTALYYAVRVWLRLYGVFGRIKDVSSSRRITDPLNSPYLYTCRGIDCLRLGIVMYANVMLVAALTCSHAI